MVMSKISLWFLLIITILLCECVLLTGASGAFLYAHGKTELYGKTEITILDETQTSVL